MYQLVPVLLWVTVGLKSVKQDSVLYAQSGKNIPSPTTKGVY